MKLTNKITWIVITCNGCIRCLSARYEHTTYQIFMSGSASHRGSPDPTPMPKLLWADTGGLSTCLYQSLTRMPNHLAIDRAISR